MAFDIQLNDSFELHFSLLFAREFGLAYTATACNKIVFRISTPPKKTQKQFSMFVVILLFVFASLGTLLGLPKDLSSGSFSSMIFIPIMF